MRPLTDADIELLCTALGLKDGVIAPCQSNYISTDATLEPCCALQAMGYLRVIAPHGPALVYEVTEVGRQVARQHLFDRKMDEFVQVRVEEEASIAAAETVGPNGYGYERLSERLSEDLKLISGVKAQLLRETFQVASDLRDALGFARAYLPESGKRDHMEAVSFVDATLAKAEALLGGPPALASIDKHKAKPSSMVPRNESVNNEAASQQAASEPETLQPQESP